MDDYVELEEPSEVIRRGDMLVFSRGAAVVADSNIGRRLGETDFQKIRRPRSTIIRDAAIEVLRTAYCHADDNLYEVRIPWAVLKRLDEATKATKDEIRGERPHWEFTTWTERDIHGRETTHAMLSQRKTPEYITTPRNECES